MYFTEKKKITNGQLGPLGSSSPKHLLLVLWAGEG